MPYKRFVVYYFKHQILFRLQKLSLMCLLLLLSVAVVAQDQRKAEGKIFDENSQPVSGATIQLKGTNIITSSVEDGSFSIPVSGASPVLIISFVGYATQEVKAGTSTLVINLIPESSSLDEVVIIGYGTQKKISVTGAVDMIGTEDIAGKPVVNLSQALQGVSPNLILQQRNFEPGQSLNINIRGLGTLGNNTPLVVIDGIVGGDLNLLNTADIESISVLKDAGTAAIYGSRAANGVLLITTKKGKLNQPTTLSYNGTLGMNVPKVLAEPVHAWENAYYKNLSLANSGQQPAFTPSQVLEFAERGDGDWRAENILQNALQQSHSISLNGGGEQNAYLMSFGYLDHQNNFVGPDYGWKRYNIRLNQQTILGKFRLNTILSYVKSTGKDHSSNSSTLIVDASRVPLYYNFQDENGNYLTNAVAAEYNPKGILEHGGYRKFNNDELFGSLSGEFQLAEGLKLRGVFGGTVKSFHTFSRRIEMSFVPGGRYGQDRETNDNNYRELLTNTQLLAEYNKEINSHSIALLVGGSNESFKSLSNNIRKTLTDPVWGIPTTGTVTDPNSGNSNQGTSEWSLNSLFGRAAYDFEEKYFAEFSFRYDGSSRFPKDGRWGFFPSFSAAWRATEENFLAEYRQNVGELKLRASYGILGNQNVGAYQYQTTYFNYQNAYGFNNQVVGGAGFSLGNPFITWEKAATLNLGIDATFFNNRLNLSFDVFDKHTSDILVPREDVPELFGSAFPDFNVAEVRNKGWEAQVDYRIPGNNFRHQFSFNIADNLNELVHYSFDADDLQLTKEEFQFVRRIGLPITVYQGYRTDGFYQTLDDIQKHPAPGNIQVQPGDLKFIDKNGDGEINDQDKFILGNPFPRYTFGFTYSVAYKNFDAQIFIQGVGQREQMIRGEMVEPFHVGYSGTMFRHQTDFWTPVNTSATWPRLAESGTPSNQNNYRIGSDIYLFDAAYARLKNVQLGYNIPQKIMDRAGFSNARIYVTGQNLFTLTKLNFLDPENTEFNNDTNMGTGANSGRAYPLPVFYGFGIDLTF